MYAEALLIIAVLLGEGLLENMILKDGSVRNVVSVIATVGMAILLPFIANYLYMLKALAFVEKAKQKYSNIEEQTAFLKRKGGISFIFFFIIIIIFVCIFIYNNYLGVNNE